MSDSLFHYVHYGITESANSAADQLVIHVLQTTNCSKDSLYQPITNNFRRRLLLKQTLLLLGAQPKQLALIDIKASFVTVFVNHGVLEMNIFLVSLACVNNCRKPFRAFFPLDISIPIDTREQEVTRMDLRELNQSFQSA